MPQAAFPLGAASPTRGLLVTLEGGEGAGKSTQLARAASWLAAGAREIVTTREPGGTANGEAVRALLLEGTAERWSPAAEAMLFAAARVDHVRHVIAPALARGAVVLCDRYVDSTRVYQGLVGGLGLAAVDRLHSEILGLPWPDLTILLDLDPAVGLARRAAQGDATRFEAKGSAFHSAVRAGFLDLAREAPDRFVTVDASVAPDAVTAALCAAVATRLGLAS